MADGSDSSCPPGQFPTAADSAAFTGVLASNGITISMDGKGAGHDNVFVERLWRSVKYGEVYLRAYDSVSDARASLDRYLVTAADHIRALTA